MKILELELCSIGLHKHLKADLNTPTVGLMGPNGFGKTTVLEFLKFLFTGKMPEGQPQESFVTGWGKEGFPNNGTGRAVFIHHGQRGEIFRQVGKTAKRWLTWGNEKYTKAADVERVLDEIFGADREAMAKAIFIPQGEMDKLFFGSTAEREEMFVKIMLLSHLQTVVNVLDGKIKAISSGLQDLTFATDDIARQREASELTLADLERQLRSCRDWSPDSRALGTYKSLVASADAALAQFELNDRLSKEASQRLWEVLNQSDDLNLRAPDVTTLETRLTEARRSLQAVQSARVVQSAYRTTLKESKSLQSTIDAIKADIAAIEKAMADYQRQLQAPTMVQQLPDRAEPAARQPVTRQPNVYVSAILDFQDGRWTVWANGYRITAQAQAPDFTVVRVKENAADIVVPGADGAKFRLYPYQTWVASHHDIVEGIFP